MEGDMSENKEKTQPKKEPPELPDKDVRPPDIEYVTNAQKREIEKRVIINEDE